MKHTFRTAVAVAITAGAGAVGVIAACSSSSGTPADNGAHQISGSSGSGGSSGTTSSGGSGASSESDAGSPGTGGQTTDALVGYDGPPPNVDGGQLSCATPDGLPIKYNPMYSGYDGVHSYQIPTLVVGMDPSTVTWGSSDPTMVDIQPYVRGVMLTTKKAGDVTIVAKIGATCGSSVLHIATYTPDEWNTGNTRYNNSMALMINPEAGIPADANFANFDASGFDASAFDAAAICAYVEDSGMFKNPFGNTTPACTNCHGASSNGKLFGMTLFTDIAHTPEQTGGFSEDDLTNVFYNGTIPEGGTFDPTITPYCIWHQAHLWRDIDTPEKQTGMRAYLRSLTPQEQTGCFELFNQNACADSGM